MSSLNRGTILQAAQGNKEAMRQVLTAMYEQFGAIAQAGGPALLEPTSGGAALAQTVQTPPVPTLAVTAANGVFNISITPASSPFGQTQYFEVSYSATSNFGSPTALPLTPATNFTFAGPGATYFWRIRATYNKANFSAYQPSTGNPGVSAGLQSSAATSNATALNITNYATVDAVPNGLGSQNVRVYGTAGPGTMWPAVKGSTETILPSATIINSPLNSKPFVAYDADSGQFVLRNTLPQVFADNLIPVGQVGTPEGGAVTEPTITANLTMGTITSYTVNTPGANISAPVTLTITDATGSGAVPGAQSIVGGQLISVAPGIPGSLYTAPTVVATGGRAPAQPGGGGIQGQNPGRYIPVLN
jgi:hypothetical protein